MNFFPPGAMVSAGAMFLGVAASRAGAGLAPTPPAELPDFSGPLIRMLVITGVLCAVLVAALWWIRRKGLARPGSSPSMRVIETLGLGAGREILLVEVAGRRLLLGMTPTTITTLQSSPLEQVGTVVQVSADDSQSASSSGRPPSPDADPSFAAVFHSIPALGKSGGTR